MPEKNVGKFATINKGKRIKHRIRKPTAGKKCVELEKIRRCLQLKTKGSLENAKNAKKGHVTELCQARLRPKIWSKLPRTGLQRNFPPGKRQSRNAKKGHVTGLCKARLCPEMWPKLPRSVSGPAKRFPAWHTAISKR